MAVFCKMRTACHGCVRMNGITFWCQFPQENLKSIAHNWPNKMKQRLLALMPRKMIAAKGVIYTVLPKALITQERNMLFVKYA